jgi:ribA/ribD-fused uncharacterized protein
MLPDAPDMTTYYAVQCAVFFRSRERHGAWSNMTSGYPIMVNNMGWTSSEALYQACRYPHNVRAQEAVFAGLNGFNAKLNAKAFISDTRPDWDAVRESVMEWVVRLKIEQNIHTLTPAIRDTEDRTIVERSSKDNFWGAAVLAGSPGCLRGYNKLGLICTKLRNEVVQNDWTPSHVIAGRIPNLKLFGAGV